MRHVAPDYPLGPVRQGVLLAVSLVSGYFCATAVGLILGAWSAGWDLYGAQECIGSFVFRCLGLRKLAGLVSFILIGIATLWYFRVAILRWEALNVIALLWTLYAYAGLNPGTEVSALILPPPLPEWRIWISLAGILFVYTGGRVVFHLGRPEGSLRFNRVRSTVP